jgi:diguanylate cyclase (GGDEF)-like protein
MAMPKVEEIMMRDVLKTDRHDTVLSMSEKMHKHRLGAIVIVDSGDYPIGIVTERDIIRAIVTYKERAINEQAGDIMSSPVLTLEPGEDIDSAIMQMQLNRVRRIPITRENKLIGIISYQDLTNALRKNYNALEKKTEELEEEANTDPLTGLYNRRVINGQLKYQIGLARRSGNPMSVIMIDIDHFKKVNDTYGHLCGDSVLKTIAGILKEKSRDINIVGRYGGEEFMIIGPISDHKTAFYMAERLRVLVENTEFSCEETGKKFRVTISAGVAVWNPRIKTGRELIKLSDDALYQAKKSGRNRVMLAEEGE